MSLFLTWIIYEQRYRLLKYPMRLYINFFWSRCFIQINNPLSAPILPHIKNKLPKLSNQLLNAARSDLLPWFTFFREKNQLIGSTILRKYAAQVLKHQKIAKSGVENSIGTDGQKVEVLEPSSISLYAIQSKGKSFSPGGCS